jgi:hypothetical protein
MKQLFIFCITALLAKSSIGQMVSFKSAQQLSEGNLKSMYASISLDENLLLFNAADYQLYAYDKRSGLLKWTYDLERKSDVQPFIIGNCIWANGKNGVVQLDTAGNLVKTLPFATIETTPFFKDGIIYGTGIYDGGSLYAYDTKKDTVLWKRFLAHGCSVRPYYLKNKIVANAEGDSWLELDYSGKLTDSLCETGEEAFPSELSCAKKFTALSHDENKIYGYFGDINRSTFGLPELFYSEKNTFILSDGALNIFGDKEVLQSSVQLSGLSDTLEMGDWGDGKILKATNETISLLCNDYLFVYNYQREKLISTTDLRKWRPHCVISDENKLWLISKKDGLLYGLKTD